MQDNNNIWRKRENKKLETIVLQKEKENKSSNGMTHDSHTLVEGTIHALPHAYIRSNSRSNR